MNYEEFSKEIVDKMKKLNINLEEQQVKQFYEYMNLLIEWNEKINLTAIIEPKEIILKHFVDCATISNLISREQNVLDIGTGAGFPGIPLKILNRNINVVLVDSLNKRVNYLNEVIRELDLKGIIAIHARAEELARNREHREKYDVLVSRAVANLTTLSEYMLPFLKIKGKCICMKGPNIKEELEDSKKAIMLLGGKIKDIVSMTLPETNMERNLIIYRENKFTPKQYPRKARKTKQRAYTIK